VLHDPLRKPHHLPRRRGVLRVPDPDADGAVDEVPGDAGDAGDVLAVEEDGAGRGFVEGGEELVLDFGSGFPVREAFAVGAAVAVVAFGGGEEGAEEEEQGCDEVVGFGYHGWLRCGSDGAGGVCGLMADVIELEDQPRVLDLRTSSVQKGGNSTRFWVVCICDGHLLARNAKDLWSCD